MKHRVLLGTGNWAKYVDKDIESQASFTVKAVKYLLNRLTPLYSEIHYEEENYLKVRTELLIYPFPPYSKGWYIRYIRYINRSYRFYKSYIPNYITWLPFIT